MTRIDRNAPCPCGSGKKYKKCCGSGSVHLFEGELNRFERYRDIAYEGSIGREREAFCLNFLERKQKIFKDIEMKQKERPH